MCFFFQKLALIRKTFFQTNIVYSKQDHLSNANWVLNQDWEKFGKDLELVQTKILKLQAVLSNDLENIQSIGNFEAKVV